MSIEIGGDTEMKAHTFVRISCGSRAEAKELVLRLEASGYAAAASTEPGDGVGRVVPSHPYAPRLQAGGSMTPAASTLWPWA